MTRPDEDARFEELMAREFPDGLVPVERARSILDDEPPRTEELSVEAVESAEPPAPASPPPGGAEPAEAFRSWSPADEPDEPFVPPAPPPARRWTSAGIAGTVLVMLPALLVLLSTLGLRLPLLVSVLAGGGFFVGVVLLLIRLRKRPPIDGDGAVV